MDDTGIKREPVIRISNDRMEAFIMLPTVEEEYHYTVDEVLEAVNRNGDIRHQLRDHFRYGRKKTYGQGSAFCKGKAGC